jgi:hypothetical protein
MDLENGITSEGRVGGHGAYGHPVLCSAPPRRFLVFPDFDSGLAHRAPKQIY